MGVKNTKPISTVLKIVVVVVLLVMVCFMMKPVLEWFKLDKWPIQVHYDTDENEVTSFQYDGKTYYLIEEIQFGSIPYGDLAMECIERARNSFVALYTLENDPEGKVFVGETPMDYCVFSCEYEALPTEGTVTGVYLHLSLPEVINGRQHLYVEKQCYENEENLLFQRLWNNRYRYEPIIFADRDLMNDPVSLLVLFCFDGCPLPSNDMQYHLSYYEGNWYFVEWQPYVENGQHTSGYFGYLIDDQEVIDYLDRFIQDKEAAG